MNRPTTILQISEKEKSQQGFTLVEMVIALIILFIAVMGVFATFTYATKFNRGNSQRSQALSVMQREIELLRSAKFTPAITSNSTTATPLCTSPDNGSRDLTAGVKAAQTRCGIDRTVYQVFTTVVDLNAGMKEITLQVVPQGADGQWVTANAIRMIFRRVRSN